MNISYHQETVPSRVQAADSNREALVAYNPSQVLRSITINYYYPVPLHFNVPLSSTVLQYGDSSKDALQQVLLLFHLKYDKLKTIIKKKERYLSFQRSSFELLICKRYTIYIMSRYQ